MASPRLTGCVAIQPSPALRQALQDALQGRDEFPQTLAGLAEGEEVLLEVQDLKWIKHNLSSSIPELGNLLLSSTLQIPSLVIPERNQDLEQRCVKLRAEQADKEYRRMTDNIRRDNNKEEPPINKQLKEVNRFLLLIIQFIVSVVCAFMFGYMGPYLLYGRQDVGGRILLGIVLGFVVGCADMYFVIRQLLEEDGIKLKKIE